MVSVIITAGLHDDETPPQVDLRKFPNVDTQTLRHLHTHACGCPLMPTEATTHVSVYIQCTQKHTRTHNFTACQISFARWPNRENTFHSSDWLITLCLYVFICLSLEAPRYLVAEWFIDWPAITCHNASESSATFIVMAINDEMGTQPILHMTFSLLVWRRAAPPVKAVAECVQCLWRLRKRIAFTIGKKVGQLISQLREKIS